MRKLKRELARANMQRAGLKQLNRRQPGQKSYFAQHWRAWATPYRKELDRTRNRRRESHGKVSRENRSN